MNCETVLSLLRGYADRELDSFDAKHVGAHVSGCPECAKSLEAEQELKLAIRAKTRVGPAPAGLAAEIKRAVRSQIGVAKEAKRANRPVAWRRRLLVPGLAVTSLLLVAFVAIWIGSSQLRAPDSRTLPSRLAMELVDDHIRYLAAEGASQIETNDPIRAEEWFAGRLDVAVSLPRFQEPSVILRGGRLCYVLERRVALLFYERGDERISLFVLSPGGLDLPRLDRGRDDMHNLAFASESFKGYSSRCWERYGLLFALVGRGDLDALVDGALYP